MLLHRFWVQVVCRLSPADAGDTDRERWARKNLIVAGWSSAIAIEIRKNIPEVDACIGRLGEGSKRSSKHLVFPRPAEAAPSLRLTSSAPLRSERLAAPHPSISHSRPPESDSAADCQRGRHLKEPEGDAREARRPLLTARGMGRRATSACQRTSTPPTRRASSPHRAPRPIIKIAEGCDHPCSFCIIPQLSRQFRSRPIASVVTEAPNTSSRRASARSHSLRPREHHLLRRRSRAGHTELGRRVGAR